MMWWMIFISVKKFAMYSYNCRHHKTQNTEHKTYHYNNSKAISFVLTSCSRLIATAIHVWLTHICTNIFIEKKLYWNSFHVLFRANCLLCPVSTVAISPKQRFYYTPPEIYGHIDFDRWMMNTVKHFCL